MATWVVLAVVSMFVERGCAVGTTQVAMRITKGCVPEQNLSVASSCEESFPATPSLTQTLSGAWSPSAFSFSHSTGKFWGLALESMCLSF